MKKKYLLLSLLFILVGLIYMSCNPKVTVETPEPLEINVNVRIDIYNHVAAVEESIYGEAEKEGEGKQNPSGGGSSLIRNFFIQPAYGAGEDDQYKAALQRRKARAQQVIQFKNEGSIGENHNGLVSLIESSKVKSDKGYAANVKRIVKEENADRETMYKIDAAKRNVSVAVIKEETARFHRENSKRGWWIEVQEGGNWIWKQK